MRVLVTGATAPLGSQLAAALLADPAVELVLAVGREPPATSAPTGRYVYRQVDLTRPRALHDLLWGEARELAIDRVVLGIHHRRARDRGPGVHAQNVGPCRELMQACSGHPTIRRLVYRSFAEVYAVGHTTSNLIDEDQALLFDPAAPQWVRDRVEADLTISAHLGGPLEIAVMRCAEILAPATGSQLWDYLQPAVCLRPIGFDPMINVLSMEDAVFALATALGSRAIGIFNVPGRDTLPLSFAIAQSRRLDVPIPGPLLAPLYGLRRWIAGSEFRYDLTAEKLHFGGVLDGSRARSVLGFTPRVAVTWSPTWWDVSLDRALTARHPS